MNNYNLFGVIPGTNISHANQEICNQEIFPLEDPDLSELLEDRPSLPFSELPDLDSEISGDLQKPGPQSANFPMSKTCFQEAVKRKSVSHAGPKKKKKSTKFTFVGFTDAVPSESVESQDADNSVNRPKPVRSHFLPEWEGSGQGGSENLDDWERVLFVAQNVYKGFQNVPIRYKRTTGWKALVRLLTETPAPGNYERLDRNWNLEFRVVDKLRHFEIQKKLSKCPPRLVWSQEFKSLEAFPIYPFKEKRNLVEDYYCLGCENAFVRFGKNKKIYVETTTEEKEPLFETIDSNSIKSAITKYEKESKIKAESGIKYYSFGYGEEKQNSRQFLLRQSGKGKEGFVPPSYDPNAHDELDINSRW
eukprot:GHVP01005688.1.p1 GENE.GHVP01005688.1~~GHVP01005688.1.p1  ORF type:complete len:380 (-),score=55.39 GHVP01005688.1:520-1605(-)